jgi:hypothetical protein
MYSRKFLVKDSLQGSQSCILQSLQPFLGKRYEYSHSVANMVESRMHQMAHNLALPPEHTCAFGLVATASTARNALRPVVNNTETLVQLALEHANAHGFVMRVGRLLPRLDGFAEGHVAGRLLNTTNLEESTHFMK